MRSLLRRWRWPHLLGAWVAYWIGLGFVTLSKPIGVAWHVARAPEGVRGSISAEMTNGVVSVQMVQDGATLWAGSASLLAIMLWIAGPPLALWILWLLGRSQEPAAEAYETGALHADVHASPALGDGAVFPDFAARRRHGERANAGPHNESGRR